MRRAVVLLVLLSACGGRQWVKDVRQRPDGSLWITHCDTGRNSVDPCYVERIHTMPEGHASDDLEHP